MREICKIQYVLAVLGHVAVLIRLMPIEQFHVDILAQEDNHASIFLFNNEMDVRSKRRFYMYSIKRAALT